MDYMSRKVLTKDDYGGAELPRGEYYGVDMSRGEELPRSVVTTPPGWEFYDLEKDPEELHNRYDDPGYAKTIVELKAQLADMRRDFSETDENYPEIQKVIDENWE